MAERDHPKDTNPFVAGSYGESVPQDESPGVTSDSVTREGASGATPSKRSGTRKG